MSFRNLVGSGAECDAGNPLMGMVKQFTGDKSHQQDQWTSNEQAMRRHVRPGEFAQRPDSMAQEFFGESQMQPGPALRNFDAMRESLAMVRNMEVANVQSMENGWSEEFTRPQAQNVVGRRIQSTYQSNFQPRYSGMMQPMIRQEPMMQQKPMPQVSQKEWDDQFAKVEQQLAKQEPMDQLAEEEKQLEQEFKDYVDDETADDFFQKFNESWKRGEDLQDVRQELDDYDWTDDYMPNPTSNTSNIYDPDPINAPLERYKMDEENPFVDATDPVEEGLRLWREGGQLSAAALCFEAAVRKDDGNAQAWMYLGQVQAENEKEEAAIAALQKAVQLDHGNLSALMSLAVSYTNEGHDMQAYASLYRWLRSAYPDVAAKDEIVVVGTDVTPREMHNRVTKLFLDAVRKGQGMDADLQVGLGVLFYNHGDYDKAVDCFSAAVAARPDDYVLWNRLGATLANSGRSEEAIAAYDKALSIKPTFVRGRYNLGVSCINIGVYKEAAEHLLGALSMHVLPESAPYNDDSWTNVSQNLWDTLRRTLILMERRDLVDFANPGTNLQVFRDAGFEF